MFVALCFQCQLQLLYFKKIIDMFYRGDRKINEHMQIKCKVCEIVHRLLQRKMKTLTKFLTVFFAGVTISFN